MIHFILNISSHHFHATFHVVPVYVPVCAGLNISMFLVLCYCNGHIAYCKWNHYQQERNSLVAGRLRQHNDGEHHQQPQNPNPQQQINNTSHNTILAEVKHIVCLLLFWSISIVSKATIVSLDTADLTPLLESSPIWLRIYDLGPPFLIRFIFPVLFYLSHPELRKYLWDCLSVAY